MALYVDSSLLLAIVKNDAHAAHAASIWDADVTRVSSLLLEAECRTVLRRVAVEHASRLRKDWLERAEDRLDGYLEEVDLHAVDADVMHRLRSERRLATRSLDAVHLATALLFADYADAPLQIGSFDTRLREAASQLGFAVVPEAIP